MSRMRRSAPGFRALRASRAGQEDLRQYLGRQPSPKPEIEVVDRIGMLPPEDEPSDDEAFATHSLSLIHI